MGTVDRQFYIEWYLRNRARSRRLFDAVDASAYESAPISLRNPICFYEGHIPAFSVNTLLRRALERPALNPEYEVLFERGIDPEHEGQVPARPRWPSRSDILDYGRRADEQVLDAIARANIAVPDEPMLRNASAVRTICEHEEMHQETVCYLLHRLPHAKKTRPDWTGGARPASSSIPKPSRVKIPAGRATLGLDPGGAQFGWDNEFPRHVVDVPAFEVDVFDTTNAEYLEFVDAGGYERRDLWTAEGRAWLENAGVKHPSFWLRREGRWFWLGQFEDVPLPPSWPVFVSHAEASAYARWKGRRLMTEPEYHRAAFGTPSGEERPHPWGADEPDATRGNFDFQNWDPVPVGSYPAGASAFGVHDLVGNGWEWTSTVFAGFEGFEPMPAYPNYSIDFFDGMHYVLKGGSPVTARSMIRSTFRNWFRPTYPFVYATFRCAAS